MLNIYYGGENIEKEKFIFEHIKGRSLLLVPDQFSLQAERDAFFYLDKTGLMDLAVVDFSALGHKILKEAGGPVPPLIDKYGRHMLLTRILEESDDALKIYKGVRGKNSFRRAGQYADLGDEALGGERGHAAGGVGISGRFQFPQVQAEGHRDPVFSVRGSHRRKVSGFGGLYYILRRQNAGFVAGSGQ